MLFSSGEKPRTLSSIPSGEGLDEGEQGSIAVIVFGASLQSEPASSSDLGACPFFPRSMLFGAIAIILALTELSAEPHHVIWKARDVRCIDTVQGQDGASLECLVPSPSYKRHF
jgi:hypothetical protein